MDVDLKLEDIRPSFNALDREAGLWLQCSLLKFM